MLSHEYKVYANIWTLNLVFCLTFVTTPWMKILWVGGKALRPTAFSQSEPSIWSVTSVLQKKKKSKKGRKKKRQHFEELNFGGKEKVSCISGLDMHLITDAQVRSITANRFLSLPLPQSQMNVPDFGAVQKSHMFCFVFWTIGKVAFLIEGSYLLTYDITNLAL